jgi:hypothetical protein
MTRAAGKAGKQKKGIDLAEGRKFWAFQPVSNPKPPLVKDTAWPVDSLDHFILKQGSQGHQARLMPIATRGFVV